MLKKTIAEQNDILDQLEQHGRRDSLRVSGIPEAAESDNTDAAILSICAAIKVDPPVQPVDIAVSHRVGKTVAGKRRQMFVKFATRNVRERVFRAKKNIKTEREENESLKNIYTNEDLTQHRANLARKPRLCKTNHTILDTWTIYGKIMIKDLHGHVKIINNEQELLDIAQHWVNWTKLGYTTLHFFPCPVFFCTLHLVEFAPTHIQLLTLSGHMTT